MELQRYIEEDVKLALREQQVVNQRRKLAGQYIQELPMKEGDKIEIDGKFVGWYEDAKISYHRSRLDIIYNPPKVDGTRSGRKHIAYGVRIEQITIKDKQDGKADYNN